MTFTEPRLDPSEHSTMTTSLDLSFTDSNAVNETLEKIVDYVDLQIFQKFWKIWELLNIF